MNDKKDFVEEVVKDIKRRLKEMKGNKHIFEKLGGLRNIIDGISSDDEVVAIMNKMQKFTEGQLDIEIEFFEGVLQEFDMVNGTPTDIETEGVVC